MIMSMEGKPEMESAIVEAEQQEEAPEVVADDEQTPEVAPPLPKFVNKAANGMASYADNVVEILKAPFRRSK